jgi:flagellar biosynthesis protein FlhB
LRSRYLSIAFERGIKVREDAELVEILSLVEVDSPIPLEAFTAVAEILAFVYQANAARKNHARPSMEGVSMALHDPNACPGGTLLQRYL